MLFISALCLLLSTTSQKWKERRHASIVDTLGKGHMKVTYYRFARATDNFKEGNLLADGNFCAVYKEILREGILIAVKDKNMHSGNAPPTTFYAECRILRESGIGTLSRSRLHAPILISENRFFSSCLMEGLICGCIQKTSFQDYFEGLMWWQIWTIQWN